MDGMVTSKMVCALSGLPWALIIIPHSGVMAEVPSCLCLWHCDDSVISLAHPTGLNWVID